jgi:mRNA interferase RelE/StbE
LHGNYAANEMTEIAFTDAAIDDLRKIGPSAVPKVLKKVLLLLDSPRTGYPLGGDLTGFRKLVVGRSGGPAYRVPGARRRH